MEMTIGDKMKEERWNEVSEIDVKKERKGRLGKEGAELDI